MSKPRDVSAVRHRVTAACEKLGRVTPHGLQSYFITQARRSGLTDAEIAMLIGDKTGPSIIAHTYGDLLPDHLLAQARRIRLTVTAGDEEAAAVMLYRTSSFQSRLTLLSRFQPPRENRDVRSLEIPPSHGRVEHSPSSGF